MVAYSSYQPFYTMFHYLVPPLISVNAVAVPTVTGKNIKSVQHNGLQPLYLNNFVSLLKLVQYICLLLIWSE